MIDSIAPTEEGTRARDARGAGLDEPLGGIVVCKARSKIAFVRHFDPNRLTVRAVVFDTSAAIGAAHLPLG